MNITRNSRIIDTLVITIIVGFLSSVSYVNAAATFSINVLQPTGGATVTNPVMVSGAWKVTNSPPGTVDEYNMQILWGDGTFNDVVYINRTDNGLTGQNKEFYGNFSTESILGCSVVDGADNCTGSSLDHTYLTTGAFTITTKLYHGQLTGNEAGDATDNVSINVAPPTCTLSATSLPSFGSLNPNDISSDQFTTLTNTGTVSTTSLTISGNDWGDGASHTMSVGKTHWALSSIAIYGTGDNVLSSSSAALGTNLASSTSQDVHFRVQVPAGQFPNPYTQTITFTGGC